MIRQGDIILKRMKRIPANVVPIIAPQLTGETGNEHNLLNASWFAATNVQYATLENDSVLVHEEHGQIPVKAGIYKVEHLRDYNPVKPAHLGSHRHRSRYEDVMD